MLAFEAAVGLDAFEKSGILVFHNRGYHKKCTIYMYVEVSQQCYGFNFHYAFKRERSTLKLCRPSIRGLFKGLSQQWHAAHIDESKQKLKMRPHTSIISNSSTYCLRVAVFLKPALCLSSSSH